MSDVVTMPADVFGMRLYRTPYFVVPRLALEAMPLDWQLRFEALLQEADAVGLQTPEYHVVRHGSEFAIVERSDSEDPYSSLSVLYLQSKDPWADYRRGNAYDLSGLKAPQP